MDVILDFLQTFITQFQKPTLAFLIGGMVVAALGSRLDIPDAIYRFIIFMLMMRIGIEGGMEIREAEIAEIVLPALMAVVAGCVIVLIGWVTLTRLPGVSMADGIATAGLFGAVSSSTLAAAMVMMNEQSVFFEAWVPALYPFMDIPALVLAIVLANVQLAKQSGKGKGAVKVGDIVKESLQGGALSAMLLGIALGLFTQPDAVFDGFYDPLFRGLLSVLMLIMGMEAYERLVELRRVAHWYGIYAFIAPPLHGLIAFGLGYIAHMVTGFSPGGVVLLSVIAASSSDISGPPTLRAGIPTANPSAFLGASTSIGTPMAIAVCIPLFLALGEIVFGV